jgi:MscS family membrane protein
LLRAVDDLAISVKYKPAFRPELFQSLTRKYLPMKNLRFENLVRATLFVIVILFCWSFLAEAQTNNPSPAVSIKSPENHSKFREGADLSFAVEISPAETNYQFVQFFDGDKAVPITSNAPGVFIWRDAPRGNHSVIARLVYPDHHTKDSAPVSIRINNAALTFGLDKLEVLTITIMRIPLWQYCASLIYIFLAFYISKGIDYAFRFWLKKWADRTETKFDDLLLELLRGPVKVLAFVIFLFVGLDLFDWPPALEAILSKGFVIIFAFSITYTALKAVDMMMNYWKERSSSIEDVHLDAHLFPIVSKTLKVFIVVVAVLVTWQNLSEKPITAILASLSIGGLAIGLAAQDTISNFFGAVVVFMDKPFRIGDMIKLTDVEGTVESIGIRSTRVRNPQGHFITVPNKTMGNATITNITRRPNIKSETNLGLTYDTSAEKLKRALVILDEIFRGHPMTHDVLITFNKFADSALNIQVVHWWKSTNAKDQLLGMHELNLAVKKRFDEEKINFAFPSQTVYLKQDSDWRMANGAAPESASRI